MRAAIVFGAVLTISSIAAKNNLTAPASPDNVNSIATAWFRAIAERNPEVAPEDTGWMAPLAARVFDNSPGALAKWHRYEDSVLTVLQQIDTVAIIGKPDWITYGILRYDLESSIGLRVCRTELWNVNSYVAGWQQLYTDVAVRQRVGTPQRREATLARARALPGLIDREITNLRQGAKLGYSAPDVIVRNVMRQLDDLTSGQPEASPFYSPAERDTARAAAEFRAQLADEIRNGINPAIRRYDGT